VSIQAQVVNLLTELKERLGLTVLFIAHDLSVVKYFCDRIAVMHFGKLVELAESKALFSRPLHPYTKSLLSAMPYPDPLYEKTRSMIAYQAVNYEAMGEDPTFREVKKGRWVYCSDKEAQEYKESLKVRK
jgi:oligopeptide/dipeptide ABC transporter ATP-binding protein